ncbi:hypothetical protein [Hydrogenimonas sp.]
MKRVAWLLALGAAGALAGSVDVHAIAKKFEQVGAWRLDPEPGYRIYDPFKRAEPLVKKAKRRVPQPKPAALRVEALMNGKAFVNGRWVEAGERVGPYRVVAVRGEGILVKEGKRTLFVPLARRKALLKIKETTR